MGLNEDIPVTNSEKREIEPDVLVLNSSQNAERAEEDQSN